MRIKRFKFSLIADNRKTLDIEKEIQKQINQTIESAEAKKIEIKIERLRNLTFPEYQNGQWKNEGTQQIRADVICKMKGTWNDVYAFVNPIRAQEVSKI